MAGDLSSLLRERLDDAFWDDLNSERATWERLCGTHYFNEAARRRIMAALAPALEQIQREIAEHQAMANARGSNGEALNAVPSCPACGSRDGALGTSNAYFLCRACGKEQYWTLDHQPPGDWPAAVALSPFGRRSVLIDALSAANERYTSERENHLETIALAASQEARAYDAEQREAALRARIDAALACAADHKSRSYILGACASAMVNALTVKESD